MKLGEGTREGESKIHEEARCYTNLHEGNRRIRSRGGCPESGMDLGGEPGFSAVLLF